MRGIRPRRVHLAGRDGPVGKTLAAMTRAVTDRFRRWRGHPPEEGGVREPRRPRPPLPAGAVALDEPRTRLRRWMKH